MFVFDKILIHSLCGVSSADSQWLIVSLVPRLRSVIFVVVSACMPRSLKLYRCKQFNFLKFLDSAGFTHTRAFLRGVAVKEGLVSAKTPG